MIEHTGSTERPPAAQDHTAESAVTTDDEHSVHLPSPSVWPIVSAFGVMMLSFGFLAGWVYGLFGAIILIVGLRGWVGDMRHE